MLKEWTDKRKQHLESGPGLTSFKHVCRCFLLLTWPLTWLITRRRAAALYDGQLSTCMLCSSCCSADGRCFALPVTTLSWKLPTA